mmetsp:Transcript_82295/g.145892  ORF Transcript_82295/g.145892 Transcript_82295/m.145892 type:complete len:229 (-) Transcript_82295:357-1043(-)
MCKQGLEASTSLLLSELAQTIAPLCFQHTIRRTLRHNTRAPLLHCSTVIAPVGIVEEKHLIIRDSGIFFQEREMCACFVGGERRLAANLQVAAIFEASGDHVLHCDSWQHLQHLHGSTADLLSRSCVGRGCDRELHTLVLAIGHLLQCLQRSWKHFYDVASRMHTNDTLATSTKITPDRPVWHHIQGVHLRLPHTHIQVEHNKLWIRTIQISRHWWWSANPQLSCGLV